MTDFSIGNVPNKDNNLQAAGELSKFETLEKKYDAFKKKTGKSDFANAPTLKRRELELVQQLKKEAEAAGLEEKVKVYESLETEIQTLLNPEPQTVQFGYYKPIQTTTLMNRGETAVQSDSISSKFDEWEKKYEKLQEKAKSKNVANTPTMKRRELELVQTLRQLAEVTENEEKIKKYRDKEEEIKGFLSCTDSSDAECINKIKSAYNVTDSDSDKAVERLRYFSVIKGGGIAPESLEAIKTLADAGVDIAHAAEIAEECNRQDNEMHGRVIDLKSCQRVANMKSLGIDDLDALKFAMFLGEGKGFENEETAISGIKKLQDAEISTIPTIDIIKKLSVRTDSGLKKINPLGVNSAVMLKNQFVRTRTNERDEQNNLINLRDVQVLDNGNMVVKNGKIIYQTPVEGEHPDFRREENKRLTQLLESKTISEFIQKYKTKDGRLDSNALRTMTALRNYGVTYGNLFPLMDECLSEKGIDYDKLAVIGKLKDAGALSCDIKTMTDAMGKDAEGKLDKADVEAACILTNAVFTGEETAKYLKKVQEEPNLKELLTVFPKAFAADKGKVPKLVELTNLSDNYDDNATKIINYLIQNQNEEQFKDISIEEFIDTAQDIIKTARKKRMLGKVDEIASGLVGLMCMNNEPVEHIKEAIHLCQNQMKVMNEGLSDVFWETYNINKDFDQASKAVRICKRKDGSINENAVQASLKKLEKGTYENNVS